MPAASPIELKIFDFIDDFARKIRGGNPTPSTVVVQTDGIVVFCESFFDQLFVRVLGASITGFDPPSKRKGVALVSRETGPLANSASLRALVTLFESFCDMYQDVIEGSYGAAEITYARFHDRYMSRLLDRALAWAREGSSQELADRIALAHLVYSDAIGAMQW